MSLVTIMRTPFVMAVTRVTWFIDKALWILKIFLSIFYVYTAIHFACRRRRQSSPEKEIYPEKAPKQKQMQKTKRDKQPTYIS